MLFVYLDGQLARGHQDEGIYVANRHLGEHLQHGDEESQGLAGSGLCRGDYVIAIKGGGNGLCLDRGWGNKFVCRQRLL